MGIVRTERIFFFIGEQPMALSAVFAATSILLTLGFMIFWIIRYTGGYKLAVAIIGFELVIGFLSALGIFSDFSRFPPPMVAVIMSVFAITIAITLSPKGATLADATPMRVLIGLQAFRLLPETLLDLAWRDGLAPIQMTWHGRNFDIVSAILAGLVWYVWPQISNKRLISILYTTVGVSLLINILSVAILSMPSPFRYFFNEPANTFVGSFPYIGLPTVQVLFALLLHGITIRKLFRTKEI